MTQFNGFKLLPIGQVNVGQIIADAREWNVEGLEADDLNEVDWVEVASLVSLDEVNGVARFTAWMLHAESLDTFEWPADLQVMVQD